MAMRTMMAAARRLLRPQAASHGLRACLPVRGMASKTPSEDWSDLNVVLKELRNISREQGLEGAMPETKLLKELGYAPLVMAIRKKHGGVVNVASKMGVTVDRDTYEMHKRLSSRAKRRKKRHTKIAQHDFY